MSDPPSGSQSRSVGFTTLAIALVSPFTSASHAVPAQVLVARLLRAARYGFSGSRGSGSEDRIYPAASEEKIGSRKMHQLLRRACHAVNLARERGGPLEPHLIELFNRRYDAIAAE